MIRSGEHFLVDAPPLLPVADSAGLATAVGGVILSVRYGETRTDQLEQAALTLGRVGARLLGVVLNIVPPKAGEILPLRGCDDPVRRWCDGWPTSAMPASGGRERAPREAGPGDDERGSTAPSGRRPRSGNAVTGRGGAWTPALVPLAISASIAAALAPGLVLVTA